MLSHYTQENEHLQISRVAKESALEDRLLALSEINISKIKNPSSYPVDTLNYKGEASLCFKWKNYLITGNDRQINVFELDKPPQSKPIQTIILFRGSIYNFGAYLILDNSTLYVAGTNSIYIIKI